jgi:diguanylate cyclase (GGDEF)-like protein
VNLGDGGIVPTSDVGRRLLRAVQLGTSFSTILTNADLIVTFASESVFDVVGMLPSDFVGRQSLDFVHPDDVSGMAELIAAQLQRPTYYGPGGDPARRALNTCRFRHSDGSYVFCEISATNLSEDPMVGGYMFYIRAAEDRKFSKLAYEHMSSGAPAHLVIDAIALMLRAQFGGADVRITMDPIEVEDLLAEQRSWRFPVLGTSTHRIACIEVVDLDALPGWEMPSVWTKRVIGEAASILRLLSQREELLNRLRSAAATDSLTGLHNRRGFMELLGTPSVSRVSNNVSALLYIDVDDFKALNDRFGHIVGDAVLAEVAKRLLAGVRDTDVVARLGGDEFAILCRDLPLGRIEQITTDLQKQFKKPIRAGSAVIDLSISVGVGATTYPDTSGLLAVADAALMEAKAAGKNTTVVTHLNESGLG